VVGRDAGGDAVNDRGVLELGKHAKHLQHHPAGRRAGVEWLGRKLPWRRARLVPGSIPARLRVMRLARYILVAATGVFATGAVAVAAPAASADLLQLPSIESESVSHVTPSDATLEAEVNLHEVSTGAYYQFQIVKNPSEYGTEIVCPSTRPQTFDGCVGPQEPGAPPIGFLPGNTAQPGTTLLASLDLASAGVTLKPGTTYHYRVLVARRVQTEDTIQWEPPTVLGADQTFTTPPAPAIEGESVSHITPTDATLEAQINTEGLSTIYEFQLTYSPCSECELVERIHLPAGLLLGSFSPQTVSLDLNSTGVTLKSGFYEYWVTATSAAGSTEGAHQVLIAPKAPAAGPVKTTVSQGPVSNEPEVPLTGGQQPTSSSNSSPAAGDPIPTDMMSKPAHPAHGKPGTKHGKRRKHHGKHTGTHHT
jgi:hypothetical protein